MLRSTLFIGLLGLFFHDTAHATTARMTGLSSNAGFIDDTDFFLYPSTLGDLPAQASLNYDNGSFDGGFTLDDGRALWFQRDAAAGTQPGFRVLYGQASGETGYLVRASHNPGDFSIGGAWSRGRGRGTPENFAVNGDLHLLNKLAGDNSDLKIALNAGVVSRSLSARKLTVWGAGINVDTNAETFNLAGGYTLGPRFSVADARLALQVGPALSINGSTGEGNQPQLLTFTLPIANFAGEYQLREWFRIRGSVVTSWVGATDSDDPLNNLTWASAVGGSLGVGFTHNDAQFDMSVNPEWALNGPHILSGVPNQMFAVLSARVKL